MPLIDAISTTHPTLDDPGYDKSTVAIDVKAFVGARALVQANSGGGKSRTLRRILEQTYGQVQHIVFDVEGEFYTLREKFDYTIAGHDGDCAATVKNAPRLARILLETGANAILDISELGEDQALFVKAFCEALVNAPRELWHLVMVVIDEAQRFCPQDEEAVSTAAVIDLMGRGRKRGFNGVLACQRLSELHKTAAAECNNLIIGRTSLDVDIARARKKLGMSAKAAEEELPRLKPGQFYCVGPGLSETVHKVWVGHVQTTHPEAGSGVVPMPPPRAITKRMLAKLADLDEQEAKEESEIETLRARVRELEGKQAITSSWNDADSAERKKTDVDVAKLRNRLAEIEAQRDNGAIRIRELERQVLKAEKWEEVHGVLLDEIAEIANELNSTIGTLGDLRNKIPDSLQEAFETIDEPTEAPAVNGTEIEHVQYAPVAHPGRLTDLERDVLTVLAQRGPQSRRKVLIYARRSRSGSTDKGFAKLITDGFVDNAGAYIEITPNGRERLGTVPPLVKTVDMPDMQRAFLTVLAQRGVTPAKKVLLFAGYARSGSTDSAFGVLNANDWTARTPAGLTITSDGLDALGPFDPLPTGAALRKSIAANLDSASRKIFDVACHAYPKLLTRADALELAGMKRSGNTDKAFAFLAARDWITKHGNGIQAAKELFE